MQMFLKEIFPLLKNTKKLIADARASGKEHAIPPSVVKILPL